MEIRTYHGTRNHRIAKVPVVGYDIATDGRVWSGGPLVPEPPAQFGWGHDIGGANHLAYALLKHATGSAVIAQDHHVRFARDVVVHWGSEWTITLDEILQWIAADVPTVAEALASPKAFIDGFTETTQTLSCATRIYRGDQLHDVKVTHITESTRVEYDLSPEQAMRMLGFRENPKYNWGIRGSGSILLSLAILLDATDRINVAKANYVNFAERLVYSWPDQFEISSMEICAWLAASGAFLAKGGA